MLNLDTHILVFALTDTLRPRERALLAREPWCISDIVLWELAKLKQRGRIAIDLGAADFRRVLDRIQVLPIDLDICRALGRLDFQSDPADEIIAATSLVHRIPLVTRDQRIGLSKVVPLAL